MRSPLLIALLAWTLAGLGCESTPPASRSGSPAPTQPTDPATAPAAAHQPPSTSPGSGGRLPKAAGVRYLEIVTGGADPDAELPMVVAIHGLGDSPEGFALLFSGFDQPTRVILPQGLDAYGEGWSWFPINVRDLDVEAIAGGITFAADALAPAIEALTESRPTTGKAIVTGFSQGGMLSFALAIRHGQLFSMALPVGGWLPPQLMPAPDRDPRASPVVPPILAFHGETDDRVPFEPTRASVLALSEMGYQVELRSYPGVGHAMPGPLRQDLMAALSQALADAAG